MVYEDESSNDLSSLEINSSSDGMMYRKRKEILMQTMTNYDVNQLLNAQEERVMDLSYLKDKVNAHDAESSSATVAVMNTELEKKEAEIMKLKGKYSMLMNLAEGQGRVIRNQKADYLKEKEKLSEEN
ncbi:hypothetical protein D1007_06943 [Hordeum vulgare]|nr:hypothetical protein D1007_06943 [Hordeum vulgare]